MRNIVDKSKKFNKNMLLIVCGLFLLFVIAAALLLSNMFEGRGSEPSMFPSVYFEGEYCIGDGAWQPVVEGEHIPSTKGDVTLKGVFHMHFPEKGEYLGPVEAGIPISFFLDHIGITVYENGQEPYVMDSENPLCGISGCGQFWIGYDLADSGEPVELVIHNPHKFGNERAIDDLLSNLSVWVSADFDRTMLAQGSFQRSIATLFLVTAFVFLGTAIFSSILRINNSRFIWVIGLSVFVAGVYMLFSSVGFYFLSDSVALNTTLLCISEIFYMLFISILVACLLSKTAKSVGMVAVFVLGIFNGAFLLISAIFDIYIYDMMLPWAIVQGILGIILSGLLIYEMFRIRTKRIIFLVVLMLLLLSFEVDFFGVLSGAWKGGMVSSCMFFGALLFAIVFVLRIVPQNLLALSKAKETELQKVRLEAEKNVIEAELKETRISTMLSQIQPHFIYNTLGTIERLCVKSPKMASELVRDFSLYLRGNFSELDSVTPIRFSKEIKHIEHYVNIEKVRFPDMTIEYKLEAPDFVLPALSVQPLVENAIKHGLMKLERGGTVVIHSYETERYFCVDVTDNGGGFDMSAPINKKEHIGLYNIRERLSAIVNGVLSVESKVGVGTTASIKIPKEDDL